MIPKIAKAITAALTAAGTMLVAFGVVDGDQLQEWAAYISAVAGAVVAGVATWAVPNRPAD